MEDLKRAFDAIASRYDAQRRYIIPGMEEFYNAAVWAADTSLEAPAILDIGAGTGLLSALLLQKYPEGKITLIDISSNMLDVARERFSDNPNVRFVVTDYSREDIQGRYDLVCSALSIHHLEQGDKRRLFSRIFEALNPGGLFVNADQAEAQSEWLSRRNIEYWDAFVSASPFPRDELKAAMKRRDTLDRNAPLLDQVTWLSKAGFSGVDIVYKNRTFCVFLGKKGE